MLGKELFGNNVLFWHGDIPKDTHLSPVIPSGWQAAMALGNLTIMAPGANGALDIGNQVSAYAGKNDKESLWFLLTNPHQERITVQACEIAFKPTFRVPPLEVSEGKLIWKTEANYVGDMKSSFLVKIRRGKEFFADYSLPNKDKVVEQQFPYEVGRFQYEVYLAVQSLFGRTEELIYKGRFTLGDENALRFDGQEVHLLTAICWDMNKKRTEDIKILNRAAVIRDIRYLGHSIPSGEAMQYPEYKGILQFYHHTLNLWLDFSDDENSAEYEYVNPIRFWPINDNMMIAYTCTGDGIYFDTSRNRLMYRKPDWNMHKGLQRVIIATPDFFAYRKDEI